MFMPLNEVITKQPLHPAWDQKKVNNLIQSMKKNGWNGQPLLFANEYLINGSHRFGALELIFESYDDIQWGNKLIDVMDIEDLPIPVIDLGEYLTNEQIDEALDFSDEDERISFLSDLLPENIFNILSLEQ